MNPACLFFAVLSLVAAAPTDSYAKQHAQTMFDMTGYEGSITNARQVQDTLTQRIKADHGSHAAEESIVAFITGADSQIDNAIATVSQALAPFTGGASQAIGNFLLGPFVQSVTNGAEVFLSNVVGNSIDGVDAGMVGMLTGDYSRLIEMGKQNKVDVSRLQNLNERLTNSLPKSKRATDADLSGIHGSMTNAAQVQDTLARQLKQAGGDPHANADRLVAFITGADSQIDNAIATVSNALAPLTGGLSKAVGNVLLGPYVQSVTNGAEVLLANLLGGGADMANAAIVSQLTGNYSKLAALAVKNDVPSAKRLQTLSQQITKTVGR